MVSYICLKITSKETLNRGLWSISANGTDLSIDFVVRLLHQKYQSILPRNELPMNHLVLARSLVLLLIGCGTISTIVVQAQSQSIEKQIELDVVEGIKHWLPIDVNVSTGEQTTLTVTGTQLFHDALVVETSDGGVAVDIDLVILCPDSRQKFTQNRSYPSRRYNGYSLRRENQNGWQLEFGKDCTVDAQDLGFPTVELTTPKLSWIEVFHSGKFKAEEMASEQVRIDVSGLAYVELENVQADIANISVSGSSGLSIDTMDTSATQVSLNGLADIEVNSLVSSRVEFNQSGTSESDITNLVTERIVLDLDGLSDFNAIEIETPSEPTDSDVAVSTLDLSGSAELTVQSLQLPRIEVDVNGLSNLDLGKLTTDRLKLSTTGSSDISIENLTTDESQIDSSGLSDLKIETLNSDVVEIRASGSADVEVQKAKVAQFDIRSSGLGDVSIKSREQSELKDG